MFVSNVSFATAYLALLEDLANNALRREHVFNVFCADLLGESTEASK